MNRRINRRDLMAGAALALGASSTARAAEPPFGLGTVTYNVPKDWDLKTLLTILPEAGLRAIEFRTTHAHGVEPSLGAPQRAEVRQRCADAGIKQLSLGTVCEFQSPDPAVVRTNIETCAEFVKLARDIGALGVKVRPNGVPRDVPLAKTLEQIGRSLIECGRIGGDHGVEIWVEVHGAVTQDPVNMRTIMDHCGHKSVGINWNSNPTDVKDGSVKEGFELLKPFLKTVHINNFASGYPYRELFQLLREANFRRYTLCEVAQSVQPDQGLAWFRTYRAHWLELAGA